MSKKVFKKMLPIEIESEDIDGNVHILQSIIPITADVVDKMTDIAIDENRKMSDRNIDQLIIIFGKDRNFWLRFDAGMLTDIITFVSKEVFHIDDVKKK